MKRQLPIGIQDFDRIRENGYCYVDKTKIIHQLITGSSSIYFLSRPRRFGKSLLCSTLCTIFEGKRELFKEIAGYPALAINSLDWEWKKHPVIRIDMNIGNFKEGTDFLNSALNNTLNNIARSFNLELRGNYSSEFFSNLIIDLNNKYKEKAVVIIDEYDKPLLDTMLDVSLHKNIRDELKGFYSILKPFGKYLRFVFLTGITKFSHVSLFSDLNNLDDLTLDPLYADICGITQEELEANFEPEIQSILNDTSMERDDYLNELRRFYNGYRFSKNPLKVYNPFGLLKHFKNGDFSSYWYETGTPSFLVNLLKEQKINILNLNNLQIDNNDLHKYDIENMRAEPILYQAGYLTIKDYNKETNQFTLDYPNIEVESCFAKSLLDEYLLTSNETAGSFNTRLINAVVKGSIDDTINTLKQFLSSIPYDIIKDTENYFQTAIHLVFTMLGLNCRSEVRIAAGRIDTLVETKNYVYCFEFKLNGTAEDALAQINTKEYLLPWEGNTKKIFKIGVDFDYEKRNIGEWKTE
ncbi:MAG: ATP-binding protein [Treponema sp.]|nr:ATP-binding protein [Treponema sp.]